LPYYLTSGNGDEFTVCGSGRLADNYANAAPDVDHDEKFLMPVSVSGIIFVRHGG
jgi:hypothetical protein